MLKEEHREGAHQHCRHFPRNSRRITRVGNLPEDASQQVSESFKSQTHQGSHGLSLTSDSPHLTPFSLFCWSNAQARKLFWLNQPFSTSFWLSGNCCIDPDYVTTLE